MPPYQCPDCHAVYTNLDDWQKHNLQAHMARNKPIMREPPASRR